MARVAAPIDLPTLTDLTLCDEGVDYFDFAEAVAELVDTDHLTHADDRYAITEKGKRNGGICESSLPYSVRVTLIAAALHADEQPGGPHPSLRIRFVPYACSSSAVLARQVHAHHDMNGAGQAVEFLDDIFPGVFVAHPEGLGRRYLRLTDGGAELVN